MGIRRKLLRPASIRQIVIYLLAALAGTGAFAEAAPTTISIATEEYPPYTSKSLKDFGVDAAIVTAAFKLEGVKTRYEFFPGARSYILARVGTMDATLPWAKRAGREKDFHYSKPVIAVDVEHFFFLTKTPLGWNSDDPSFTKLKGLSIAAITGHNYGEAFQAAEKRALFEVVRLSKLHQGFSMLLAGRVQAVISKKHVATPVLRERFSAGQRAEMASLPVSRAGKKFDYLLISKRSKHGRYFLNALNRGLGKLHESGVYQQLMDDLADGAYSKRNR
jgi:polar amino acid transport system substrate-binding protein